MSTPTFIWVPSYTTGFDWEPDVLSVAYGDGYDQEIPDGINNDRLKGNLVFQKITDTEANAIVDFIRSLKGTKVFYWTPPAPFDDLLLWKAKKMSYTFVETNANDIVLPIIQNFNPI